MLDLTGRKSVEELEKIPNPSNKSLKLLFQNIDKVVIKDDGVYNNRAIGDKILFTISEPDKIIQFRDFLKLDEQNIGFYCMCSGTYAIELHSGNQTQTTIGFHHGYSIRYDGWNSDAALANSDELLHFLFELGFKEPLQDRIKAEKSYEKQKKEDDKWLSNAPKCFSKYWDEMNDLDDEYIPSLVEDFKSELADRNLQIRSLLQTFGLSKNLWTDYPIYEDVPFEILTNYSVQHIISAYQGLPKTSLIQIGLGRFLCSFEFTKIRKKYLSQIPQNVIDDIKKVFESINELEGLRRIEKLQIEKNNS